MRYFIHLGYLGTHFHGWQRQPNAVTVQEKIESALSTFLKNPTTIYGCGRTDTGVHAKRYYAHFETTQSFEQKAIIKSVDALSGTDIVIYDIYPVGDDMHARFDAVSRSYDYFLDTRKDPFVQGLSYCHLSSKDLKLDKLQQAANLLLSYQEFFPFAKTNSDTPHYLCDVRVAQWHQLSPNKYKFNITANRFLRGMVRLIVGMCIQVAEDKVSLKEVKYALDHQSPLIKSWSVPPEGLYLSDVNYGNQKSRI